MKRLPSLRRSLLGVLALLSLVLFWSLSSSRSSATEEVRRFLKDYAESPIRPDDVTGPVSGANTKFIRERPQLRDEIRRARTSFASENGWSKIERNQSVQFTHIGSRPFGGLAEGVGLGRFFPRLTTSVIVTYRIGGGTRVMVWSSGRAIRP